MKIGRKLALGFAIVVTLTLLLGIVGIVRDRDIGAKTQAYHTVYLPARNIIADLRVDIEELIRATEEYDAGWMTKEEAQKEIDERKADIASELDDLKGYATETVGAGLSSAKDLPSAAEVEQLKSSVNGFYDLSASLFSLHGQSLAARTPVMQKFDDSVSEIDVELTAFLDRIDAASKMSADSIMTTIASSTSTGILVLVLVVLAATVISIVIATSISRPVTHLRNAAIAIGKGDLSRRAAVKSKDEIGEMAASFNQMAGEIQERDQQLTQVNEELRATNEELEASNEELRATEEELRASNEELMAANTELKEAQEKLVRSEKLAAIGKLAGGVGHELRNPLGAIKNAVYYIRGKVAKSEVAQKEPRVMEFLDIVDEEIGSSTKIISDLLTFSRVNKPAVSPARIETVIDTALSHTTIPANVTLNRALANGLPDVLIDTDQIRQVLINLVTNAVQAMPEGGKLTISAQQADGFLEVQVADTGCGIPDDAMRHLFEPLYTTKAKGIGLGLAVCKSIVERHEGHIAAVSQPGKGTSFTVSLPLKSQSQSEANNGKN